MLLTASSRPMTMLSLPLRSNSWLSASTIRRAVRAAGVAVPTAAGAACGAGAPSILPQLEQKASPAGLTEPQDGHVWLPAGAGAAGAGAGAGTAVATGAALASGSPHSSQKAEPSGFSWPKEHCIVISYLLPKTITPEPMWRNLCFTPTHQGRISSRRWVSLRVLLPIDLTCSCEICPP